MKKKRFAVASNLCVACGTCLKKCPKNAMSVTDGVRVRIDLEKCVGCGLCVKICPASVIEIYEVAI